MSSALSSFVGIPFAAPEGTAFLPKFLFHCSWECLLAKLERVGKDKLIQYVSKSLLQKNDGVWSASWQTSFEECEPGYSTFLSNCQESKWAADQVLAGPGAPYEVIQGEIMYIHPPLPHVWAEGIPKRRGGV